MPHVGDFAGLTAVNYRSEPYKFGDEQGCYLRKKMFQPCTVDKALDRLHAGHPAPYPRDLRQ
jgi:hypothetical protein